MSLEHRATGLMALEGLTRPTSRRLAGLRLGLENVKTRARAVQRAQGAEVDTVMKPIPITWGLKGA